MLPGKENDLLFHGPIPRWDEGIPLGNGLCGCLVWGSSDELRFSLDWGDLWESTPNPETLRADFCYDAMRQLVREQRWEELSRRFCRPYDCPYPTKLAAGGMRLALGVDAQMESRLSLEDALASFRMTLDDGPLTLRVFLHADLYAGFLLLSRIPKAFSWKVVCPGYRFAKEKALPTPPFPAGDAPLSAFTFPEPQIYSEPDVRGFSLCISDRLCYELLARHFSTQEGELIVWDIAVGTPGEDLHTPLYEKLGRLAQKGFEANFASHRQWWRQWWAYSGLRISHRLFEQNWYLTQYLLGACSRRGCPPMPLQGVWTADEGILPPWKGDYHHDLNTQFSYSCYLKANRLEAGACFLDYLWDRLPAAKQFAHDFYHAEGICLPAVMTLDGKPLCGWPMYSFTPSGQIWLCQQFERYYRFTGDRQFLRDRAYPYLRETARFVLCLLQEGEDGLLYLPLSSSPEIHDNLPGAWLTPNSNFDLALLRYLFEQLISLCPDALCPEDIPEELARWTSVLARLPQLAVNDRHVYRLSPDEDLQESHRHFSHLMALYPLRLTEYDTKENRQIIDACITDLERLGSGFWVGYSFCWMAQLYALQKNAEGAAVQLELFWRYFCSPNGFHLNGDYKKGGFSTWHYRPFTLEANMLAADALQEMLLYSEKNTLCLFPAVPGHLGDIAFEHFRTQNGLLVSARREGGAVTQVELHATRPCKVTLKDAAALSPLCTGRPCRITRLSNGDADILFA